MDNSFQLGEINGSAAYRLASQVVIPRLRVEVFPTKGSAPFSLRDEIYAILNDEIAKGHLTQEQIGTTARVNSSGVNTSLASQTRWYVRHILKSSGEIISSDIRGLFILPNAEVIEEEQEEEDDEVQSIAGSIYAYSFPSLNGSMIKVGKASGNVEDRIRQQLGTANPEAPTILRTWSVIDIGALEMAIHSILKARGKWIDAPRAKEWFRTSVEEIDSIIKFVKEGSA
ncbi:MAG: GIY-YIG nuclease family protein [Pseudomonadota bacterium]